MMLRLMGSWVWYWKLVRGVVGAARGPLSRLTAARAKGMTPALLAMSASPKAQCIASAALHGTASSSATLDHISGLNLRLVSVER